MNRPAIAGKPLIGYLILIILAMGTFSCNKNDDNPLPNDPSGVLTNGSWRITYFRDRDKDETAHYSGYDFIFGSNNSLTAVQGSATVTGTWASGTDNSKRKLIVGFSTPDDFEELSEDWEVITIASTVIELKHTSGGDGHTDYLTFEKN
ncbi:MAG: hypothetical protein EOO02_21440 [Chitinophagaceae bacterium]|nr:MAG: hypothetical protein EOO02_21440 [Chitinophagaceae bacterium]